MEKKMVTNSFSETEEAGQNFAREILASKPQKQAAIMTLSGDLGAGKTTFLQGFAKGLGIEEVVNSPTFIIMKKFEIRNPKSETNTKYQIPNTQYSFFYHIDCYRLESPEEILALGFQEIISDPKNIVAIEWPEKISQILPKNIISIHFSHLEESEREILIEW